MGDETVVQKAKEEAVVEKGNDKAAIEKALIDPTKKRKAEDEIEIDLKSSVPLSKKQKRLLRRGKITLEDLNAKYNIDPASIDEFHKEQKEKNGEGSENTDDKAKDRFGVWVGNLSFDTTQDEITKFIIAKTKDNEDEESRITESNIVRVKLPLAKNDGKQIKNKGFCYIDFKTDKLVKAAINLTENQLNGRNLLIKDSKSYEGRPDKEDLVSMSKNPPSRILFVGNLSYTTTEELLKSHFQHCGEIIKVRMATFEDTGKCKGFAFIDFKNEEGATNALKDKSVRKIAMRPVRMEYGEDRSKRQVRRRPDQPKKSFDLPSSSSSSNYNNDGPRYSNNKNNRSSDSSSYSKEKTFKKPFRKTTPMESNNRVKSSIALASAQRGSAAIVPSQGKKMKFD